MYMGALFQQFNKTNSSNGRQMESKETHLQLPSLEL